MPSKQKMHRIGFYFKQALQSLKHKPGFVFSIAITMGITLGALIYTITLNHLLLIKSLPYPGYDNLFLVKQALSDQHKQIAHRGGSYQAYTQLYRQKDLFINSSFMYYAWDLIIDHPRQPRVNTIQTTAEYFELFLVPMLLGRGFEHSEGIDNAQAVAVISYNTWKTHFGLNPDILQHKIRLGNIHYKIIGVIARDFVEPELYQTGRKTDIWLPWDISGDWQRTTMAAQYRLIDEFIFVGKTADATAIHQTEQTLRAQLEPVWQEMSALQQLPRDYDHHIELTPLKQQILGTTQSTTLMMLIGATGLILIACTNMINLFMSRTAERHRQLAIHAAIGAKRRHLFLTVWVEAGLLMILAVMIALLITHLGCQLTQTQLADIFPRVQELRLNGFTLLIAIILALLLSLSFAAISISTIHYRRLNASLSSSGKGTGFQVPKSIRNAFISTQIAIATVLIFANIHLLLQALEPILQDKGFDIDNTYMLYTVPSNLPFPSMDERIAFTRIVRKTLLHLPEVSAVSLAYPPDQQLNLKPYTALPNDKSVSAYAKRVDHHYFQLVEQTIITGRNFVVQDIRDNEQNFNQQTSQNAQAVAIINQTLANSIRNESDAVGFSIRSKDNHSFKIIGIVSDTVLPGEIKSEPRIYFPSSEAGFTFIVKFKTGKALDRARIVHIIQQSDTRYAPYLYEALSKKYQKQLFPQIVTAFSSTILALLVLLLAGIGLYGVLSYSTQLRRFELGTRMAVGAKSTKLIHLIIKDNSAAILLGIAMSMIMGLLLYLGIESYRLNFIDHNIFITLITTIVLIGGISLAACYLPLRKIINFPTIHSLKGVK